MRETPVVCCLLYVVCCLLYVVCCLLYVVCSLLYVVCCLLYVVCCLLYVVCCLLYVVCCLLYVVCYLLYVVCCLLYVVCCLLYVVWCLLYVVCCLLYVVCCLLYVVCCLLYVVCYLLYVVCCLLYVVCCLLYVVWCLLYVVCCLLYVVCCLLYVVCCLLYVVCCLDDRHSSRCMWGDDLLVGRQTPMSCLWRYANAVASFQTKAFCEEGTPISSMSRVSSLSSLHCSEARHSVDRVGSTELPNAHRVVGVSVVKGDGDPGGQPASLTNERRWVVFRGFSLWRVYACFTISVFSHFTYRYMMYTDVTWYVSVVSSPPFSISSCLIAVVTTVFAWHPVCRVKRPRF